MRQEARLTNRVKGRRKKTMQKYSTANQKDFEQRLA
jgi:hypothetical protein